MAEYPIKRCAIYTRKSSEEGLEQDYNSLHSQRDACEAHIKSQHGEGWRLIKPPYDDGGFSGGTMARPSLQQLLASIRQGLVDVVVVYKVDRLTRSLADFARMIELFDAQGVSFVAVTQHFNTTTSIGQLTLNVLPSFAQFEREVTGERIRDKVAASKRKGIWTGGSVPLGYEVRERRLLINAEEAPIVRQIFERYLELGTVRKVMRDLSARGIASAIRVSTGNRRGGKPFGRGALYHLLSNPVYRGEIRHKDERHPGQHEALISRELWERVQIQLRSKPGRQSETRETEAPRSPLTARLFDEHSEPLYVQGCAKGRQRYRYYVSKALVRGDGNSNENGWRLSAAAIEQTVASAAVTLLSDQDVIITAAEHSNIDQGRLSSVLKCVRALIERLQSADHLDSALREVVERVQLSPKAIRLLLTIRLPSKGGPATDMISLTKDFPMQIKRQGVEMRMVLAGESGAVRFDRSLLRAVGRARRWSQQLLSGRPFNWCDRSQRENRTTVYTRPHAARVSFTQNRERGRLCKGVSRRNGPSSASPDELISRSFGPHNSRYSVLAIRFELSPLILPQERQLGPAKSWPGDRRGICRSTKNSPRSLVPKTDAEPPHTRPFRKILWGFLKSRD